MRLYRLASMLIVPALLVATAIAHAGPSKSDVAEAKQRYELAETLKDRKRYVEAAAEYLAAYDLVEGPFLVFNAGLMYWEQGDQARAVEQFERYLALEPKGKGAQIASQRVRTYRVERAVEAAQALESKGRHGDAAGKYLEAYDLSEDPEHVYLAGEVLWRGNEPERAVAQLKRYLELDAQAPRAQSARDRIAEYEARTRPVAALTPLRLPSVGGPLSADASSVMTDPRLHRRWAPWKPWSVTATGGLVLGLGAVMHWRAAVNFQAVDDSIIACGNCVSSPDVFRTYDRATAQRGVARFAYIAGASTLAAGLVLTWFNRARPTPGAMVPVIQPSADGAVVGVAARF